MGTKKQWCVYKHTNIANGKMYIGITSMPPAKRWQSGAGYQYGQTLFFRAISKYTWDGFQHEILQPDLTWIPYYHRMPYKTSNIMDQETAEELERYFIAYYHTCSDDPLCHGYNMTTGGGVTQVSEEMRQKMSENMGRRFENNPELREEIRTRQQGGSNSNARSVVQFSIDGEFLAEFPTVIAAEQEIGGNISSCCCGTCLTAKGFIFLHKDSYEENPNILKERIERIQNPLPTADHLHKEVCQFSLSGELLNIFPSVIAASEATQIAYKSIQATAAGVCLTGNGYIWRYLDEVEGAINPIDGNNLRRPRAVSQYSKTGEYIATFPNGIEAARALSIDGSAIAACCRKNRNYVGGFSWCYADEKFSLPQPKTHRQLYQIDINGNVIKLWDSAAEANRHFNVQSIGSAARGISQSSVGYIWCFRDEWNLFSEKEKTVYVATRADTLVLDREVVCVTLNKTFASVVVAEMETGISRSGIYDCCNGKRKTTEKMMWCFKYIWDSFSEDDKKVYISSRSEKITAEKKIPVINVLTGEIFSSCLQAAKKYSGKSQMITMSCGFDSYYKSAYGQIWCFLDCWGSYDVTQKEQYVLRKRSLQGITNRRSVINITTGEVFDSLQSACNKYGMTVQALIGALSTSNTKHKKSAKCVWCYHDIWSCMTEAEREIYIADKESKKRSRPPKYVKNITTGVIYPSAMDAAIATGANDESIRMCCNGKRKSAGGFVWEWIKNER